MPDEAKPHHTRDADGRATTETADGWLARWRGSPRCSAGPCHVRCTQCWPSVPVFFPEPEAGNHANHRR